MTALVFPNAWWGAVDGGEHVFFHDGEIVRWWPRPGRVILWAGAVRRGAAAAPRRERPAALDQLRVGM